MTEATGDPLLQIDDLRTAFHTDEGTTVAVDGVSLRVDAGQTLGLVGESGSGKSVTSLSVMQLLPGGVAKQVVAASIDNKKNAGNCAV